MDFVKIVTHTGWKRKVFRWDKQQKTMPNDSNKQLKRKVLKWDKQQKTMLLPQ